MTCYLTKITSKSLVTTIPSYPNAGFPSPHTVLRRSRCIYATVEDNTFQYSQVESEPQADSLLLEYQPVADTSKWDRTEQDSHLFDYSSNEIVLQVLPPKRVSTVTQGSSAVTQYHLRRCNHCSIQLRKSDHSRKSLIPGWLNKWIGGGVKSRGINFFRRKRTKWPFTYGPNGRPRPSHNSSGSIGRVHKRCRFLMESGILENKRPRVL